MQKKKIIMLANLLLDNYLWSVGWIDDRYVYA